MNKLILSITATAVILTAGITPTANAASTTTKQTVAVSKEKFSDVKGHWAYDTIKWALDNNIVQGYPDGTFQPNRQVSEAEFLVMFVRAFGVNPLPPVVMNHWADAYYSFAISKNYPVRGTTDNDVRNSFINREYVAEIITAANGVNFVGKDAIQYLLNKEYSNGKTAATVAGFKGEDLLTRSETIQFIKNLKDQGMTALIEKPELSTPIDQMPHAPAALPKTVQAVKDKMEQVVPSSPDYKDYQVLVSDEGVSVAKNKRGGVSYGLAQSEGGTDSVIIFEVNTDGMIKLAVEMLRAAGVAVPDSFATDIKKAADTGIKSTHKIGTRTVTIWPHPTNADYVSIDYLR